jgi:hypothetical protein
MADVPRAREPKPANSLAETFRLLRALADLCRLLRMYLLSPSRGYLGGGETCLLYGPVEELQRDSADWFNKVPSELLGGDLGYGMTYRVRGPEDFQKVRADGFTKLTRDLVSIFRLVRKALKAGRLQKRLARRYTAPVRFGNISSTCYAFLVKDVAVPCIRVLRHVWVNATGELRPISSPRFLFTAAQLAEVAERFEAGKVLVFPGNPSEQLEATYAAFRDLIVSLRQEEAWAAEQEKLTAGGEDTRHTPTDAPTQAAERSNGRAGQQANGQTVGPATTQPDKPDKQPDKPDNSEDQKKKSSGRKPRNPKVRGLCEQLAKERRRGIPAIEIARHFAGGDNRKANSLYRQACRFRELWDRSAN